LNEWLRECHFYAILFAMKATIYVAGRIVIPKLLRQALELKPGQPLEIRAGDGRLEIEAECPNSLLLPGTTCANLLQQQLPRLPVNDVLHCPVERVHLLIMRL